MSLSFIEKLEARVKEIDSLLCVGLDPHEADLFPTKPAAPPTEAERCQAALSFCKTLIDATLPYAACYKPNAAFFEALGAAGGNQVLQQVCRELIPDSVPVLLDVKRGDIGSTAQAYARACFEEGVGADGVTLSPLMGWDSVEPFVMTPDKKAASGKGAFLLCKTSNPGSEDFLTLNVAAQERLYERIARVVAEEWTPKVMGNAGAATSISSPLGLVVGATDPEALAQARLAAGPTVWILTPGVGAQGGDLKETLRRGLVADSDVGRVLLPVSRGIARAASPAQAAKELVEQIRTVRQELQQPDLSTADASALLPYQKAFLEFSLKEGVLKFGSFVLKSGRTSPYFFNAGLFATGEALHRLGDAYADAVANHPTFVKDKKEPQFDVIFGPAYKGIPLGALVSASLFRKYGFDIQFAYNRKEAKDHGEGGKLVGPALENKRVLIVDDVITAGTAIRETYSLLQTISATAAGVVIALDRAEKRSLEDPVSAVQAVQRDLQMEVVSIVNLPQLQTFLERSPDHPSSVLDEVKAYRTQYGV